MAEVTRNNYHRYLENPQEFASETEWKLAMMCTVLGQDFKVRYDPSLISASQQRASNRVFFANPNLVFITGCLNDSRTGTCASLPVLYVAIGRRLGYPMHLVTAKTHLFARWDNGRDTVVNLEAANSGGFTNHPDSYYRTWPLPISPEEEKAGCYLKNLTAAQALAVFLTIRAASLQATGKTQDAITAAATAYRLAPALGGIPDALTNALIATRRSNADEMIHQQQLAGQRYDPNLPPDPQPGIPYQIPIPGPNPRPSFPQPPRPAFPQPANRYFPAPH